MTKPGYLFLISITSLAFHLEAVARVELVTGTASSKGKVVYIEKHRVEYADDGKLLSAETSYESPDGKPLAILKSDFTSSLTVPDHNVQDFRSGHVEGLRRENGNIVLYDKEKDKSEKSRQLTASDAGNRILVGCQGLNYYLLGNLNNGKPIQSLPLRFLIPGKLDYYDFDMKEITQPDKSVAEFEISVKSWFLKLFAPKLHAKYDRKTKRLIWYQGLSNIKNDKGDLQSVEIEYKYSDDGKVEKVNAG